MDDRVADLNDTDLRYIVHISLVGNMDDVTEPKKWRLPYFCCLC